MKEWMWRTCAGSVAGGHTQHGPSHRQPRAAGRRLGASRQAGLRLLPAAFTLRTPLPGPACSEICVKQSTGNMWS